MGLFKKVVYTIIFVLFFISLFVLSLTWNKLTINNISVSGNSSVSDSDILAVVNPILSEKHLWIIRTDNLFLIDNSEIKKQIMDDFPKINSVKVGFHGLTSIVVSVSERTPDSIWCKGTPANTGQCFFMDDTGFIYGEAPKFSGNPFPEYFGILDNDNPMAQNYFGEERFTEIRSLFKKLVICSFRRSISMLPMSTNIKSALLMAEKFSEMTANLSINR